MEEFLKVLFEAKEATLVAGDKSVKIKQVDVNENTCKGCVLDSINSCARYCKTHKQFRIVRN